MLSLRAVLPGGEHSYVQRRTSCVAVDPTKARRRDIGPYLQHWGLGVDSVEGADEGRFAWEDRCQFQVWLMMHLALHHAHHQRSSTPYYRLAPHPRSPRLPSGYVLLLFASFFPTLWRWLMTPALESWKRNPDAHVEPVRWRLVCLPSDYSLSARGQGPA